MSRREIIEKDIVECWLAYDQSVAVKDMQGTHEYRLDICVLVAYLLNTYLDADETVDWRGTWADRLLSDAQITSQSSGVRTASGLMVCGDKGANHMYLTPFRSEFVCSADLQTLQSYTLFFAPEGPWERQGAALVVPSTKDENVRCELRNRMGPQGGWGTVYCKN
jgi:hypothetical protein